MVQRKDLRILSWRQAPGTSTVQTTVGAVPSGMRRNVYYYKASSVGATAAQLEVNQHFSATPVSNWRRDFTYVDAKSVNPIPTGPTIDVPVIVFDENTFIQSNCSGAEVDVTMVFADE